MKAQNYFTGCLLGGAVGDAMGAPIEFHSIQAIRKQYGPQGLVDYVELNSLGLAEFTDDTQMTLFTAEGILCAVARAGKIEPGTFTESIFHAYESWLRTQYGEFKQQSSSLKTSYLLRQKALWKRKAPGNTCLSALNSGKMGQIERPINDSKGCGGVMRVAPVGLALDASIFGGAAFQVGCQAAAITHGHPSGYLSAGFFAQLIAESLAGKSFDDGVSTCLKLLEDQPAHEETSRAVRRAISFAQDSSIPCAPETIENIGGGWVGEEALAIALYAVYVGLRENSFTRGVLMAVNHSGDCDSTASLAGNLLGIYLGQDAIPADWLRLLELKSLIEELAVDLHTSYQNPVTLKNKFICF